MPVTIDGSATVAANTAVVYGTGGTLPSVGGALGALSSFGVVQNTQTFSASGTWTRPASGNFAIVRVWGAGGSGGKGTGNSYGGGGGGFQERVFAYSDLPSTATVTIGAGGAAVTTANTAGTVGGTTSFGSLLYAYGGGGGGTTNAGGGGGSGSAGETNNGVNGTAATSLNGVAFVIAGMIDISGSTVTSVGNSTAGFVTVNANLKNGPGNDGTYGGGLGGSPSVANGSASIWGGGGGGRGSSATQYFGGTSTFGGAGGNGGVNTASATVGTAPGGGGGGTYNGATSGRGGDGRCEVYVC